MKFGFHRVSIWVNMQKKFHVPRCTVSEKNAMISFKISKLRPRIMKFFLYEASIWVNIKNNFMFLSRTLLEKNGMLTASYDRIFLKKCTTEEQEIFFV